MQYIDKINGIIEKVCSTQERNLEAASDAIAGALSKGRLFMLSVRGIPICLRKKFSTEQEDSFVCVRFWRTKLCCTAERFEAAS